MRTEQQTRDFISKLAQDLRNHPECIEIFLWEAYYGEMLGFDENGDAYHRNSGERFIPSEDKIN